MELEDYKLALGLALKAKGEALAEAREEQAAVYADTLELVVEYCDAGGFEHEAARLAGIDRMTVRKARGKR
jgi:hypothetical protein